MSYNFNDILYAYKKIGVKEGDNILVKGDLRYLGSYDDETNDLSIPEAHFKALAKIINLKKGSITVSTASESICNTKIPFDIKNTKSERGVFSEYVRKLNKSLRSFHPFNSHASIGKKAKFICNNVSRHSFGSNTPKDRMLKCNTKYLIIGLHPRLTCSYVHHAEMLMGVPYRYTKEFYHPIKEKKKVNYQHFYMFVCYKGLKLKRNLNVNLFKFLKNKITIKTCKLGEGNIYFYDCNKFLSLTMSFLKKNIYGWLSYPPKKRIYAK